MPPAAAPRSRVPSRHCACSAARRPRRRSADTQIAISGNRIIRLGDVATVVDGTAEQRTLARLNGREITAFWIQKAKGASEVQSMDRVIAEIAKISKENPQVKIELFDDNVKYTREQYKGAIRSLIEGAVLAVIVVFIFLRDWRATVISALAIPLSIIPAFFFMDIMGFSLNFLSLLALSLVAGILVDDAIVEIENIVRHMRMGKSAWQASLDAADEIGLAVVATTMAIVAVFLPVALMPGISGQFFKSFGLTVVAAVMMSLLVARLITPLCAAYFLKAHGHREHASGPVMQRYIGFLRWSIRHRWWTVFAGFVALVLTGVIAKQLPLAFQPSIDSGQSSVTVEMAPGVRLEDVKRISAQAAALLRKRPEVKQVFENIGGDEEVRFAYLNVNLVPRAERKLTTVEFERDMAPTLRQLPDARVNFQSQTGGIGGHDITVMLVSDDPLLLHHAAENLVGGMKRLPALRDAHIDADLQRPEIVIRPHFDLAASMGVSVAALSQTIRIATIGDVPQNLAKFSLSDRQIPIRVQLPESSRGSLDTLQNLPVPTASGGTVPLKVVADIGFGEGAVKIRRFNQGRRIAVVADLGPGAQGGDANNAIHALPEIQAPAGGREGSRGRRGGVAGRTVHQLHLRAGRGCPAGVRGAGAAVPPGDAAVRQHGVAVPGAAGRGARIVGNQHRRLIAGVYRPADAVRHRRQELDPADRLRHRADARRVRPSRGDPRCRPQAGAADRHDLGRDDRGHGADRAVARHRRVVAAADGHRGDRRYRHVDGADPDHRAGRLHHRRRYREVAGPALRQVVHQRR